jgi:hypothetical protein
MKTFNEWIGSLNESSLNFQTDNLDDLIAAIHRLPDTIKYINVTDRLCSFSPGSRPFAPKDYNMGGMGGGDVVRGDPDWRRKAEEVLRELKVKTSKEKWDQVDQMVLRGYAGGGPTDAFYTQFSWPEEREFDQAMHDGGRNPNRFYGSLD